MAIVSYTQEGKIQLFKRSPLFWIIWGVVVVTLLTLVIFFINNALVKITYQWAPEARESGVGISTISGELPGRTQDIGFLPGGYAFIPRDTRNISVIGEESETSQYIHGLPVFSIPEISLTLEPQVKLAKRGSESQGCNVRMNNRTYTHSCENTAVSEYTQGTNELWQLRTLPEAGVSNIYGRHKDGFIALAYTEIGERPTTLQQLRIGSSMEVISSASLPEDFSRPETDDAILVYTDNTNPDNDAFVVGNITTGKFLVYNNVSQPPVASFERPENINPSFENTLCDLTGGKFTCYYGQPSSFHENTQEHQEYLAEDDGLSRRGTIEVRDINNPSEPLISHERRVDFGIDEMTQDNHGNLYTLTQSTLIAWDTEDLSYGVLANDVTNTATAQDGVVYTKNNGVYGYDSTKSVSHLQFRSQHLIIGGIETYGDTTLFNAFARTSENTGIRSIPQIYELTDTPLPASERRPEEALPFGNADDNIGNMDYNDDYIQVSVIPAMGLSLNSNGQGIGYDREGTLQRRDEIRTKIEETGVVGDREILFFVYGSGIRL